RPAARPAGLARPAVARGGARGARPRAVRDGRAGGAPGGSGRSAAQRRGGRGDPLAAGIDRGGHRRRGPPGPRGRWEARARFPPARRGARLRETADGGGAGAARGGGRESRRGRGAGGARGGRLDCHGARERALAEQLERLKAEGTSPAAAALAQEARELARQLEAGRLDQLTIRRQQQLYRRLLDAGRTLQGEEPDEKQERVSRAATGD